MHYEKASINRSSQEEERNAYRILVGGGGGGGDPVRNRPPGRKWDNNVKVLLRTISCENVHWTGFIWHKEVETLGPLTVHTVHC